MTSELSDEAKAVLKKFEAGEVLTDEEIELLPDDEELEVDPKALEAE